MFRDMLGSNKSRYPKEHLIYYIDLDVKKAHNTSNKIMQKTGLHL